MSVERNNLSSVTIATPKDATTSKPMLKRKNIMSCPRPKIERECFNDKITAQQVFA